MSLAATKHLERFNYFSRYSSLTFYTLPLGFSLYLFPRLIGYLARDSVESIRMSDVR